MAVTWEDLLKMAKAQQAPVGSNPDPEGEVFPEPEPEVDLDEEAEAEAVEEEPDFEDATPELRKANDTLGEIKTVLTDFSNRIAALEAVQHTMAKSMAKAFKIPLPKKSVTSVAEIGAASTSPLAKAQGGKLTHKPFTAETQQEAYALLQKYQVDWQTQGIMESQIQKSIRNPQYQLDPQYIKLLMDLAAREAAGGR